jgi:hypothetical protein
MQMANSQHSSLVNFTQLIGGVIGLAVAGTGEY